MQKRNRYPKPPEQGPERQKPVPEVEPVDLKPKFDLNAQLDEIEREQWESSKRDELETVPPSAEPDQRLAGW